MLVGMEFSAEHDVCRSVVGCYTGLCAVIAYDHTELKNLSGGFLLRGDEIAVCQVNLDVLECCHGRKCSDQTDKQEDIPQNLSFHKCFIG